jgi:hypothetical protein
MGNFSSTIVVTGHQVSIVVLEANFAQYRGENCFMPIRNRTSTAQSQSRSPITTPTELISNITLKGMIQTSSSVGAHFIKLAESKVTVIGFLLTVLDFLEFLGHSRNSNTFRKRSSSF